ncbi:MAG TPA: hypothetical protein VGD46_15545 [Rhizobacter sp.]
MSLPLIPIADHPVAFITCPECSTRFTTASEAAVCIERYGLCFRCLMVGLGPEAREREQAQGHREVPCPTCVMTGDIHCPTCGGNRRAVELLDGSAHVDIRQTPQ